MNLAGRFQQFLFRWRSDGTAPLRLGQRRIFIVPSRGGLLFALALVVMLLGAINGFLVWWLDIPAIVVTLGTMTIFRGLAFVESGGAWVNAHEMSPAFLELPRTLILGLPVLSWIGILAILLATILFTRTGLGRAFYATGVDTYGRAQKYVEADKAFIQFAGLTAGRATSFYDFYQTDIELTNF